jgi:hypothetical protein
MILDDILHFFQFNKNITRKYSGVGMDKRSLPPDIEFALREIDRNRNFRVQGSEELDIFLLRSGSNL